VQLIDIVSPKLLFKNYVYVSSTSPTFIQHFKELASYLKEKFNLASDSLIVDIGSNDGILLRPFKELGMNVLGVDPAEKIAQQATKNGIETLPNFFTPDIAKGIVENKGKAKIITATSVFSHVDNLDSLVQGVKDLLDQDGVFVLEVYYLGKLIEKNLFDMIYHEHLSYFSVKTLSALMERLGMEVFDVEITDTHGGSLRAFVQNKNGPHKKQQSVKQFLEEEEKNKLHEISTLKNFSVKIENNKKDLINLIQKLKSNGKKIVGYGAPAKGNTLLNYFGIGTEILDYIVDDSPNKQGLFTPGKHIPVFSFDKLSVDPPDYILILAWNFSDPIMEKCSEFENFIVPVPVPTILSNTVEQDLNVIVHSIKEEAKALEGKTILITGGSGFIGSYFVATVDLLNKKYFKNPCKVISLDNYIVGKGKRKNNLIKEINNEDVKFIDHDVCKPFKIEESVDYIVSAAGVASPVYYKQFPIQTIEGTIFGIKNALELAMEKKTRSLLYFSSSEIYGDPDPNFIPTPENYKGNVSSIGSRSCYDESKRIGETLCMAYFKVHNSPVKIVRPFNVFGPGMNGTDYRVIPKFLSQGLGGESLTVHDQGNQTRTFCYVTDAMIGFFKVLLSEKNGIVYNVGNNNDEINMRSLADMVASEIFKNKIKVKLIKYPDNYPQDEPKRRCPDLTKITTELNYRSSIDIKTGLKRSFKWFKSNAV